MEEGKVGRFWRPSWDSHCRHPHVYYFTPAIEEATLESQATHYPSLSGLAVFIVFIPLQSSISLLSLKLGISSSMARAPTQPPCQNRALIIPHHGQVYSFSPSMQPLDYGLLLESYSAAPSTGALCFDLILSYPRSPQSPLSWGYTSFTPTSIHTESPLSHVFWHPHGFFRWCPCNYRSRVKSCHQRNAIKCPRVPTKL